MQVKRKRIVLALLAVVGISVGFLAAPRSEVHTTTTSNRLVSVQHFPEMQMCDTGLSPADVWAIQQLSPPRQPVVQMAALQQQPARPPQNRPAAAPAAPAANRTLKPERTIRDADPT